MANVFDEGDLVRCSAIFKDTSDAYVDPTAVFFKYENPAGTETLLTYITDAAVVRDSIGLYHCDVSVTTHGVWRFRWYSTGTGQAAGEDFFVVTPSNF